MSRAISTLLSCRGSVMMMGLIFGEDNLVEDGYMHFCWVAPFRARAGYPFNSNEEMETELRPLMEAIAKEPASGSDPGTLHVGDSVLFVSHVGPDGSGVYADAVRSRI